MSGRVDLACAASELNPGFNSSDAAQAKLTGTGSECVSIVNNAPNWLVRTRAHKKPCYSGKMIACMQPFQRRETSDEVKFASLRRSFRVAGTAACRLVK